jgi:hypothetical protein
MNFADGHPQDENDVKTFYTLWEKNNTKKTFFITFTRRILEIN